MIFTDAEQDGVVKPLALRQPNEPLPHWIGAGEQEQGILGSGVQKCLSKQPPPPNIPAPLRPPLLLRQCLLQFFVGL